MQMAQTPLHVSAGHNRTEIVKFLLDWQGADKGVDNCKNPKVGWSNMLLVVLVENLILKGED